jgi:bacillopeptidase F
MDRDFAVARQTSRGPSACDGGVFPSVLAPGVAIRTTDLSHGGQLSFTTVSGSSLAAPHVSGVLALLAGAVPSASVAELEAAVLTSLQSTGVGKTSAKAELPGRLDALAALKVLQAQPTRSAGVLPIQR